MKEREQGEGGTGRKGEWRVGHGSGQREKVGREGYEQLKIKGGGGTKERREEKEGKVWKG